MVYARRGSGTFNIQSDYGQTNSMARPNSQLLFVFRQQNIVARNILKLATQAITATHTSTLLRNEKLGL